MCFHWKAVGQCGPRDENQSWTEKMGRGRFVLTAWTATGTGRREVTEFFDEPLSGFVCERAAVQSAEFVLIQHMVKIARGMLDVSQVGGKGGNTIINAKVRGKKPVAMYSIWSIQ